MSVPAIGCALLWLAAALVFAIYRRRAAVELTGLRGCLPLIFVYIGVLTVTYMLAVGVDGAGTAFYVVLSVPAAGILCGALFLRTLARDNERIAAMLETGDTEGALREIKRVIERRGETAQRHNLLGQVHQIRGEWQEAHDAYAEAERLAGAARPRDAFETAVDAFDDAPSGQATIYRANRAVALWKTGQPELALPLLERARVHLPDEIMVALNLCELYFELGRKVEAEAECERAETLPRPPGSDEVIAAELKRCRELLSG